MTSSYSVSKSDELARVIGNMRRSIPELYGVMIASTDGLPIAHDFPESSAERVAAMAATAFGLGGRIAERTDLGGFAEAVIRGQSGYLVTYAAGNDAVLVMTGPIDSNLGLMRIEARVAAVEIKQLLGRA
ncbi:MAG: roadblock/LC7 domain-containing protein [Actinomycetia bacterium]|nr:roadblock/LC7 domain-containing protein [Actinomycetes bacterium]